MGRTGYNFIRKTYEPYRKEKNIAGYTTIITKQGVMITASAPNISCSDGKTYFWSGTTLTGPFGMSSFNVRSFEEAVGIVIGYYGGRTY